VIAKVGGFANVILVVFWIFSFAHSERKKNEAAINKFFHIELGKYIVIQY
jgi:hypothetical protein